MIARHTAPTLSTSRVVIVNADDFGQSLGINRGVVEAHQRGIVTSASLMVAWPASADAAAYARRNPDLSLGLHVDLGEWAYRDEEWVQVYQVVADDDPAAIATEIARQISVFRDLVGADPTHLDSHQHVHRDEPVRTILQRVARQLGVPLRDFSPRLRYCGDFYGQSEEGTSFPEGISSANLIRILSHLPAGVTELGCHPGFGEDVDSMYRAERSAEVHALCDVQVRAAIDSLAIELGTFHILADQSVA